MQQMEWKLVPTQPTAEMVGTVNPFKKPKTREMFESGRQSWRNYRGLPHNA